MKKYFVLIIFFICKFSYAQPENRTVHGIGTGIGFKSPMGGWGIFYNCTHDFKACNIEANIGCGYKYGLVLAGGMGIRTFSNSNKKIECYLEGAYSYNFPAEARYESGSKVDYYDLTNSQYSHFYLLGKFNFTKDASIQIRSGYTFLVNSVNINHKAGPNERYTTVTNTINGGILLGIDFIVHFP